MRELCKLIKMERSFKILENYILQMAISFSKWNKKHKLPKDTAATILTVDCKKDSSNKKRWMIVRPDAFDIVKLE